MRLKGDRTFRAGTYTNSSGTRSNLTSVSSLSRPNCRGIFTSANALPHALGVALTSPRPLWDGAHFRSQIHFICPAYAAAWVSSALAAHILIYCIALWPPECQRVERPWRELRQACDGAVSCSCMLCIAPGSGLICRTRPSSCSNR